VIRNNSNHLRKVGQSNTFDMWEEVRRLSGKQRNQSNITSFTPDQLNLHYSNISTDTNYMKPPYKKLVHQNENYISEETTFHYLERLKKTASGSDNLPFWFLRLGAPVFCKPLSHVINLSISSSTVPLQWKSAVIHPIPKISQPTDPSDLRPISVLPIFSRLTEKHIVKTILNPALFTLPRHLDIRNQFAYRPTGSTTALLISMLSHITELLKTNCFVHIISFDYSKAFDTIQHKAVAAKLATIDIPDVIYNWIINYLEDRKHVTYYNNNYSSPSSINASIVQGSALGPFLFNLNSCELQAKYHSNRYFKYADDAYLVVPSSNSSTLPEEIEHHVLWAHGCNLKINANKTQEMIICRRGIPEPSPTLGVSRVEIMKILGVFVDNRLSFNVNVEKCIVAIHQSFYALKILRTRGLSTSMINCVFKSLVLSKLLYASCAWWGYLNQTQINRLESVLRKAKRFNYYCEDEPDALTIQEHSDRNLFHSIIANGNHVLNILLPPVKEINYNLRQRGHDFVLPSKDDKNFITRCLFKFI